jgi:hypothetical protein
MAIKLRRHAVGLLAGFRFEVTKAVVSLKFNVFSKSCSYSPILHPNNEHVELRNALGRTGVDVMITIFCDFQQFSAKNWRFSQKPTL